MHAIASTETLTRLWTAARAMFARMCAAIGDARVVADHVWIDAAERREIVSWLGPLEAMARRIVLTHAAMLVRAPCAPQAPRLLRPRMKTARARTFALRLWPRPRPAPARIRRLGPPLLVSEIYRDRARLAAARHLAAARLKRAPTPLRLARRMEALMRIIDKPEAAARRLARKLRIAPRTAIQIAAKALPRTTRYDDPEYSESGRTAYWSAAELVDTS